jgi:hypothetical protein
MIHRRRRFVYSLSLSLMAWLAQPVTFELGKPSAFAGQVERKDEKVNLAKHMENPEC